MSNHLVKCRRNVHSKEFHVKKGLTLARTCSIPFSMFPDIYVMLFFNLKFAEETFTHRCIDNWNCYVKT